MLKTCLRYLADMVGLALAGPLYARHMALVPVVVARRDPLRYDRREPPTPRGF